MSCVYTSVLRKWKIWKDRIVNFLYIILGPPLWNKARCCCLNRCLCSLSISQWRADESMMKAGFRFTFSDLNCFPRSNNPFVCFFLVWKPWRMHKNGNFHLSGNLWEWLVKVVMWQWTRSKLFFFVNSRNKKCILSGANIDIKYKLFWITTSFS